MSTYKLSNGNIIVAGADFIAANYPDAVLQAEPVADPRHAIVAQLTAIDTTTGMSRSLRECFIAAGTASAYVQQQETAAAALRAQLAALG